MSEERTWYVMGGACPIPMEDEIIHTAANNYTCDDPTCPCHGDPQPQEQQKHCHGKTWQGNYCYYGGHYLEQ